MTLPMIICAYASLTFPNLTQPSPTSSHVMPFCTYLITREWLDANPWNFVRTIYLIPCKFVISCTRDECCKSRSGMMTSSATILCMPNLIEPNSFAQDNSLYLISCFWRLLCGHYAIDDYSNFTLLNFAFFRKGIRTFKPNRPMGRHRGNQLHETGFI
jgi:hypothetical protein